ncbi:MAG TPA: TaqI-like C-terminal specificity domain-containing protein [Verrucomicrobiota bacterium]|nr:TaqI-like C-terminal specificity domain-containing protein [Verrucomicrobiota bacterium]
MPSATTFESFEKELNRLVESFGKRLAELKQSGYSEAQLRDDFLNPLFRALGWDMENRLGLIQQKREVEIESRTHIGGRNKRADYLFRTDGNDRWVCEAKKPAEELTAKYAFQSKRYAFNKDLAFAVLTDFEELKIFIVGSRPYLDEPDVGLWKHWNFRQYPLLARELWDLLSRDAVAGGSIDRLIESLPKKPTGKGRHKQQWLIKPDRSRALDAQFLKDLDEARQGLASDLWKHNDHDELLDDNKLNEAVQRILDRILFLRICEDRDIDTGTTLKSIVELWRKNTGHEDEGRRAHQQPMGFREEPPADYGMAGIRAPKDSLWRMIVRHFRALDHRPPGRIPFFNGNLFKPHFSETLIVGDDWLAGFINDLSDEESLYLFDVIKVEILGSVYERFLGKVVRPHGKGITVEEKPEVRKAGGVYYTPRYIVDYIVEQTCGKLLDEISGVSPHPDPLPRGEGTATTDSSKSKTLDSDPALGAIPPLLGERAGVRADVTLKTFERRTAALRFLDPACGSGSFLIRAFERVCEHWQKRLTADLREVLDCGGKRSATPLSDSDDVTAAKAPTPLRSAGAVQEVEARAWLKKHRPLCWVDDQTGDVHLTVDLKRRILTQNIYGVDLDSAAVEVTQLSLYLKMLENENRTTLERERELFAEAVALLPPLQDNIKCGNSLIASDFSMMPEDLVRVRAFDWPVQFAPIMKAGGFDAVIGNPPYVLLGPEMFDGQTIEYLRRYEVAQYKADLFHIFIEKGISLTREKGAFGMIVPNTWLTLQFTDRLRRYIAGKASISELVMFDHLVFEDANVFTALLFVDKQKPSANHRVKVRKVSKADSSKGIADVPANEASQSAWAASEGCVFETRLTGREGKLVERIIKSFPSLESVARASLGAQAYNSSKHTKEQIEKRVFHADHKKGKDYLPELAGNDVGRYEINRERGQWIKYGPWLHDYRTMDWLEGPRILIREISGPKPHSIFGAYVEETYCHYKTILNVNPSDKTTFSMKYLLGILNSRLISFLYPFVSNKLVAQAFPRLSVGDVKRLPIAAVDINNRADKSRHDRLVLLVDKMLGLMPKLRAATSESKKATLQNAVTATDQQIDHLVYELYGLTPEEIRLVEGGQ